MEELDSRTTVPQAQAPLFPVPGEETMAQPDAAGAEAETGQTQSGLRLLREVIETILLTLVIFVVINALTGRFRIEGPSMKPTLHEGQYLIISKVVYRLHPPRRGDIIVFHHPRDSTRDLIKRVVGLPGEEVEVRNNQVLINGAPLEEPYVAHWGGRSAHHTLGPDEYFVLGDNRPNSDDSRSWGGLERDMIVGKAWVAYWPPSDWGGISHYSYPNDVPAQGQRTGASND